MTTWPLLRTGRALRAAFAALLLAAAAPALLAAPVEVVDERGAIVRLAQPPQRIVTLLPSLTETVCVLGACERLVGVDRYSNWPAPVHNLPQVGGGIDPNVEAVVALKPDLVLLAKSSRVVDRLQALGLKVAVLEPKTQADVERVMAKVGTLLGQPGAPALWQRLQGELDAAAQSVPPARRGQRVYFEVNNGPYAAGESSFMGETLARLGARNIVPAAMGPFPKLNPEFVVRADPDLIMVSVRSAAGMEQRPGWAGIRAVRDGRICRFSAAQADVLVRPGPRMGEAARLMADCLSGRPLAE
ncbi:iron complex transport system substrate-binding protein [Pseudacidovorax intermedius]|uniref:Iron complex transport system substrate-binding protein n=1 Tax=Pseudacidovorax intermedius TaxID=433924 RepID=A0A370FAC7_9BURK|nr:helical backbone metal receptor [Pseudacidovorax intermedius]RDI21270.1 iron complex transport system substrate-binding protein [Pseudacidovorax intermedius]